MELRFEEKAPEQAARERPPFDALGVQNLPDAELILFPDSNHGSHFQFTERFNRYVTDFVDR